MTTPTVTAVTAERKPAQAGNQPVRRSNARSLRTPLRPWHQPAPAQAERSIGKPIPQELRRDLEGRLDRDLSDVRLHVDEAAAELAAALNADAVTVGRDIFFARGAFAPETPAGRRLLLHEIVHTTQAGPVIDPERRLRESDHLPDLHPAEDDARRSNDAEERQAAAGPTTPSQTRPAEPARYSSLLSRLLQPQPLDPVGLVDRIADLIEHRLKHDPQDQRGVARAQLARIDSDLKGRVVECLDRRMSASNATQVHELDEAGAPVGEPSLGAESDIATQPDHTGHSEASRSEPSHPVSDESPTTTAGQQQTAQDQLDEAGPVSAKPGQQPEAAAAAAEPKAAADKDGEPQPDEIDGGVTSSSIADKPAPEATEGGGDAPDAKAEHGKPTAGAGGGAGAPGGGDAADPAVIDRMMPAAAKALVTMSRPVPHGAAPEDRPAPGEERSAAEAESAEGFAGEAAPATGAAPAGNDAPTGGGVSPGAAGVTAGAKSDEAPPAPAIEPAPSLPVDGPLPTPAAPPLPPAPPPEAPPPELAKADEADREEIQAEHAAKQPDDVPAGHAEATTLPADGEAAAPTTESNDVEGQDPTTVAAQAAGPGGDETKAEGGEPAGPQEQAGEETPAGAEAAAAPGGEADDGGDAPPPDPACAGMGGGGAEGGGAAETEEGAAAPDTDDPAVAMKVAAGARPDRMLGALDSADGASDKTAAKEAEALSSSPPTLGVSESSVDLPPAPADATVTARRQVPPPAASAAASPTSPTEAPVHAAAPPTPSVKVTGAADGSITEADAQRVQSAVQNLPTTDPTLPGSVAAPPPVALTGSADPAPVAAQADAVVAHTADTAQATKADIQAPLGERDVHAEAAAESLVGKVEGPAAAATKGAAKPVADDVAGIVADSTDGDRLRGLAAGTQSGFATARSSYADGQAKAREQSSKDTKAEVGKSATDQRGTRDQLLTDVEGERGRQLQAADGLSSELQTKAKDQSSQTLTKVKGVRQEADDRVATKVSSSNATVRDAKQQAETKAKQEKEKASKETPGLLGKIAGAINKFIDDVASAIGAAFELARKAITAAIKELNELAQATLKWALEQATSLLRAVADVLTAITDTLLAAFPELRDKLRKYIRDKIDQAINALTALAKALREALQKVLDFLVKALNFLIDAMKKAFKDLVDGVRKAVKDAIAAAKNALAALGEWMDLVRDVAGDPIGWVKKLGAAAYSGVKDHLWCAFKTAVKAWFNEKVEGIIGVGKAILKALKTGGITFKKIAGMAWEAIKAAIPGILIQLIIEKLISLLIPAASALMLIIESLKAAWGTISKIIAVISKFFAFLKAVKSGGGAVAFAQLLAAGAIAAIEFVAQWLLSKLKGAASKVGDKLKDLAAKFGKALMKVGKSLFKGAKKAAGTLARGAKVAFRAAVKGGKSAAGAVARGAKTVGRGIVKGAKAVGRGIAKGARAVGRGIRKGAKWLANTKVGKALMNSKVGKAIGRGWGKVKDFTKKQVDRVKKWWEHRNSPEGKQERLERGVKRARPWIQRGLAAGLPRALLRGMSRPIAWAFGLSNITVGTGEPAPISGVINPVLEIVEGFPVHIEEVLLFMRTISEQLVQEQAPSADELDQTVRPDQTLRIGASGGSEIPMSNNVLRDISVLQKLDREAGQGETARLALAGGGGRVWWRKQRFSGDQVVYQARSLNRGPWRQRALHTYGKVAEKVDFAQRGRIQRVVSKLEDRLKRFAGGPSSASESSSLLSAQTDQKITNISARFQSERESALAFQQSLMVGSAQPADRDVAFARYLSVTHEAAHRDISQVASMGLASDLAVHGQINPAQLIGGAEAGGNLVAPRGAKAVAKDVTANLREIAEAKADPERRQHADRMYREMEERGNPRHQPKRRARKGKPYTTVKERIKAEVELLRNWVKLNARLFGASQDAEKNTNRLKEEIAKRLRQIYGVEHGAAGSGRVA